MGSLDPTYDFFTPDNEADFNKKLLNYGAISIKQILARYRSLYPTFVTDKIDPETRTKIQEFSEKVNINIEFFEVI